jgi:hypothetical protein
MVAIVIPPACREHVAGDLHERYTSPGDYILEAAHTVPLVIASRIRRTTDSGVLLLEALGLYLVLYAAAWELDRAFLYSRRGLFLLAIPAALTLVALVIGDAYASPRNRSPLRPILDAGRAVAIAFVLDFGLRTMDTGWVVPRWTLACGLGAGLVLVAMVRLLFPPWTEPPKAG